MNMFYFVNNQALGFLLFVTVFEIVFPATMI